MKINKSKKTICLAVTALVLMLGLSVGSAMAYFTAVDTAAGGVELDLEFAKVDLDETVENRQKIITLTNTGVEDCYVRVKALAGDAFALTYMADDNWTPGEGGYYYYDAILAPGEATSQIIVNVPFPDMKDMTEDDQKEFNVIIIQEHTPVLYDEDGDAFADWNSTKIEVTQK